MSEEELEKLSIMIAEKIIISQKEVLTLTEAATYIGISNSCLYKLTSKGEIPFYKPNGKAIYFNRTELIEWVQRYRCSTKEEIEQKAQSYCTKRANPILVKTLKN